jgi:uncharacterized protein (DUF1499 family)
LAASDEVLPSFFCYTKVRKRTQEAIMLKNFIRAILNSQATSSEKARDPLLRSRLYKHKKNETMEMVIATLQKMPGFKLLHVEEEVGEILLETRSVFGRPMDVTVTVIAENPIRTFVDVYSASRWSFGDFGANRRVIIKLFEQFDRKLNQVK